MAAERNGEKLHTHTHTSTHACFYTEPTKRPILPPSRDRLSSSVSLCSVSHSLFFPVKAALDKCIKIKKSANFSSYSLLSFSLSVIELEVPKDHTMWLTKGGVGSRPPHPPRPNGIGPLEALVVHSHYTFKPWALLWQLAFYRNTPKPQNIYIKKTTNINNIWPVLKARPKSRYLDSSDLKKQKQW